MVNGSRIGRPPVGLEVDFKSYRTSSDLRRTLWNRRRRRHQASRQHTDRVAVAGLPASAAELARDSITGGLAVAARLGDPALAASPKAAYLHGMTLVLLACASIAVAGAGLAAAFLPGRVARRDRTEAPYRGQAA
jgi:hypothetical protein